MLVAILILTVPVFADIIVAGNYQIIAVSEVGSSNQDAYVSGLDHVGDSGFTW